MSYGRFGVYAVAVAVAAIALVPSEALAQSSSAPSASPPASGACALAAKPGVAEQQLTSDGRPRTYRLFVPQSYDGHTPLPVVLDLHGSGGNSAGQAATSRFEALAAREGFAVATLQAVIEGNRWNVPVTADRPNDVQYVSDVIDHVAARVCTDAKRVYATGFSGGACRLNNRIAAIAPMAGLRWPGPCQGRAIPVLTFHGLADPQNTYDGHVESRGIEWLESVPDALASWARHNGCARQSVFEDPAGPLSTIRYEGCRDGAEVRLVRVDGLVHQWAREQVDATAQMWAFFRSHSL